MPKSKQPKSVNTTSGTSYVRLSDGEPEAPKQSCYDAFLRLFKKKPVLDKQIEEIEKKQKTDIRVK